MRIRWTLPAKQDLEDAHSYIQLSNPAAARGFARQIRDAVNRLRDFPEIGAQLRGIPSERALRSLVVGQHRIIYSIEPDHLLVLRLWDCRQDPESMWKDLT